MDTSLLITIIGTIASLLGAYISFTQSKEAKKSKSAAELAKKATLQARDKIFRHFQLEQLIVFKGECDKFVRLLEKTAGSKEVPNGRSPKYVENKLEHFLTLFNESISMATDREDLRVLLEEKYNIISAKRSSVTTDDKESIRNLLDEMRSLARLINDNKTSNKLSVE